MANHLPDKRDILPESGCQRTPVALNSVQNWRRECQPVD